MASRLTRFRCENGALNDRSVKQKQGKLVDGLLQIAREQAEIRK